MRAALISPAELFDRFGSFAFAIPKARIFTLAVHATMMFSGVMSR